MGQDNLATKAQVSTSDEQEPGSTEELEFINPSPEEQLSLIESMSEDGAFVLEEEEQLGLVQVVMKKGIIKPKEEPPKTATPLDEPAPASPPSAPAKLDGLYESNVKEDEGYFYVDTTVGLLILNPKQLATESTESTAKISFQKMTSDGLQKNLQTGKLPKKNILPTFLLRRRC